MTQTEILKQVIRTYRFDRTMPGHVRRKAAKEEKKTLIIILKKQGRYTLFLLLVFSIFFLARRSGLILSMAKSAICAAVVTAAAAGIVTGTAIYTADRIIRSHTVIEKHGNIIKNTVVKEEQNQLPVKKVPRRIKAPARYEIGFVSVQAPDIDPAAARRINSCLLSALRRSAGPGRIGPYKRSERTYRPLRILIGSAVPLKQGYRVTLKVVDTESSRVLYMGSGDIMSDSEIDRVCEEIISDLVRKL